MGADIIYGHINMIASLCNERKTGLTRSSHPTLHKPQARQTRKTDFQIHLAWMQADAYEISPMPSTFSR